MFRNVKKNQIAFNLQNMSSYIIKGNADVFARGKKYTQAFKAMSCPDSNRLLQTMCFTKFCMFIVLSVSTAR